MRVAFALLLAIPVALGATMSLAESPIEAPLESPSDPGSVRLTSTEAEGAARLAVDATWRNEMVLAETDREERYNRWLLNLDSDEYFIRESTSRELTRAGRYAIPVLQRAAVGDSAEASSRAFVILHRLLYEDAKSAATAQAALESLATNDDPVVVRRANGILRKHREHAVRSAGDWCGTPRINAMARRAPMPAKPVADVERGKKPPRVSDDDPFAEPRK